APCPFPAGADKPPAIRRLDQREAGSRHDDKAGSWYRLQLKHASAHGSSRLEVAPGVDSGVSVGTTSSRCVVGDPKVLWPANALRASLAASASAGPRSSTCARWSASGAIR